MDTYDRTQSLDTYDRTQSLDTYGRTQSLIRRAERHGWRLAERLVFGAVLVHPNTRREVCIRCRPGTVLVYCTRCSAKVTV